jgi:hypothetical protein
MTPITYGGKLVALVGSDRCHVIAPDLDAEARQTVLLMCIYVSQHPKETTSEHGLSARAEAWAREVAPTLSRPR